MIFPRFGSRREEGASKREHMMLEDRVTRGFPFLPYSSQTEWFSDDHGHQKWEVVFPFWERSHSMNSTWQWGREENHPYRTLIPLNVGGCEIYLHHWIS